eukprot:1198373-Pyramimonas_sp.AAC.1
MAVQAEANPCVCIAFGCVEDAGPPPSLARSCLAWAVAQALPRWAICPCDAKLPIKSLKWLAKPTRPSPLPS